MSHAGLLAFLQQPELAKLLDMREFAAAYVDPKGVVVWPCGLALHPEQLSLRLKLQHFVIGAEFEMSGSHWRCTDVGVRTIIATKLDPATDQLQDDHGDHASLVSKRRT